MRRSQLLAALLFLFVLTGKSLAAACQVFSAVDQEAESEWVIDLEREQENRENRSVETSPFEEVIERTGFLQYQFFAPSTMDNFPNKSTALADVFIDNITPPPNF
ncbi:MAG: hypothetical protein NVV59_06370 [Chitinophagaceae bacterium]|nr:hypothetical protein [Chitinophagaceae bacterium]